MKILIIEDEPLVAKSLAKIVKELEDKAEILGPLWGVQQSKDWLAVNPQPDLILADIQLADGVSLEIFSSDHPGCPVIFTTAFNEYAIRAFKVNSIDYLLKPIDKKELESAFQKFHFLQSKFANQAYLNEVMELFKDLKSGKKFKDRFAVHSGRSMVIVHEQEVSCFIKEEIIYLVNREGRRFIADYRSLDEVEELVDPKKFFRANRQFLVQLHAIKSFRTDDTSKILLTIHEMNEEVAVSKEKAAEFKQWFNS